MLTVIVAGRNDDYGKDFRERLFRTALHNSSLLSAAEVDFEYILAEWNPLSDRPPLSEDFVSRIPNARAVIVPSEVHQKYSLNPQMPFHEMAAKNAALRRAGGDCIIVTNADILFSEGLVRRIAGGNFAADTLYRAHRIDVKPELDWIEMQNPGNQLPSGEGTLPPPYYLGAGGDFCLASRTLWHSLRGFNEHVRFSTRAKDWQFFLSAAARGIEIEFIGDVFHLDHEGGFRNTSAAELNTNAVHFGRWWDIEFGLPVTNRDDWGFYGLAEHVGENDPRIITLDPKNYAVSHAQDQLDRQVMAWVTRPPDSPDTAAALLFHVICGAHRENRRLICRLRDARLAATLSGFDAVASRFSVEICCNWNWPVISGFSLRAFATEPDVLRHTDWIFEENDHGIRIYEYGSGCDIDVLPTLARVNAPEFNPVLSRRWLRACLQLQKQGTTKIVICGAGSHTQSLLRWGLPDNIELLAIVGSNDLRSASGIARSLKKGKTAGREAPVDHSNPPPAILLSSASFESDMLETCRRRGIDAVIALYGDWPRDLWAANSMTFISDRR